MGFKNKNIKCVSFTDFFLQGNKNNKSILLFQILIMNCCQNSHKVDKSMRIICSCYILRISGGRNKRYTCKPVVDFYHLCLIQHIS